MAESVQSNSSVDYFYLQSNAQVTSWSELAKQLHCAHEKKPHWAWRGEDRFYCKHKSQFDRCLQPGLSLPQRLMIERSVSQRFREHAPNFLSPIEREYLQSRWSQLVLMKHYLAPTRLLDWTKSPWVAAFFAVSGNWTKDGRIYGFHRNKLEQRFEKKYGDEVDKEIVAFGRHRGQQGFSTKEWDIAVENDCLFDSAFVEKLSDWIITYYSRLAHFPRLVAQQGLFTFASKPGLDHWETVVRFLDKGDYHIITISSDAKLRILGGLNDMGLNAATLFPGADGIGRYIEGFARTSPSRSPKRRLEGGHLGRLPSSL